MPASNHANPSLSTPLSTVDEDTTFSLNNKASTSLNSPPNSDSPSNPASSATTNETSTPSQPFPNFSTASPVFPAAAATRHQQQRQQRRRSSVFSSSSSLSSTTSVPGTNAMFGVPGLASPGGSGGLGGSAMLVHDHQADAFNNNYSQYLRGISGSGNGSSGSNWTAQAESSGGKHSRFSSLSFGFGKSSSNSHVNNNHNQSPSTKTKPKPSSTTAPSSSSSSSSSSHHHQNPHQEYVPQAYGSSGVFAQTEKLRQDLELEQMETANLDRQLRETRTKLTRSLDLQSQLENDVVTMAKEVAGLTAQIKEYKKSVHNLETEMSQEQVYNLNEKKQWLDKEQEYEREMKKMREEINRLVKMVPNEHSKALPSPVDSMHLSPNNSNNTNFNNNNTNNDSNCKQYGHKKQFSANSFTSFAGFGLTRPTNTFSSAYSSSSSSSSSSSVSSNVSNSTTVTSYPTQSPIVSSFTSTFPFSTSSGFGSHSSSSTASNSSSYTSASSPAAKDKIIEQLKMELEQLRQQTELVSREYTIRHSQIETRLKQQQKKMERVEQENVEFQYLLAEKAVLGGFKENEKSHDDTRIGRDGEEGNQKDYDSDTTPTKSSIDPLDKQFIGTTHNNSKIIGADNTSNANTTNNTKSAQQDSLQDSEIRRLQRHNKALSMALERLVQRLLEFKQFENGVTGSSVSGILDSKSFSLFQSRVNTLPLLSLPTGSSFQKGDTTNNDQCHCYSYNNTNNNNGFSQRNGSFLSLPTMGRHHGTRDSVSSAATSLSSKRTSFSSTASASFGKSIRSLKNPTRWSNMLLGGGLVLNVSGASSINNAMMGPNTGLSASSPSRLSFMDSHEPDLSSTTLSLSKPDSRASKDTIIISTGNDDNNDGDEISDGNRYEREHENHDEDGSNAVLNEIKMVLLETSNGASATTTIRRPSTTSQRSLRPLSMMSNNNNRNSSSSSNHHS